MKDRRYLKAAEMITKDDGDFCCLVLEYLKIDDAKFNKLFKPENIRPGLPYFGFFWEKENQLARQLALILMYEMGS